MKDIAISRPNLLPNKFYKKVTTCSSGVTAVVMFRLVPAFENQNAQMMLLRIHRHAQLVSYLMTSSTSSHDSALLVQVNIEMWRVRQKGSMMFTWTHSERIIRKQPALSALPCAT